MPFALAENKVVCAWPWDGSPALPGELKGCVQPGTIPVKVVDKETKAEVELEFCTGHYENAALLWGPMAEAAA